MTALDCANRALSLKLMAVEALNYGPGGIFYRPKMQNGTQTETRQGSEANAEVHCYFVIAGEGIQPYNFSQNRDP